jgi:hypothetical protein
VTDAADRAGQAAVRWLDRHPRKAGALLELADEAWFWRMVVLRHGPDDDRLGRVTLRVAACLDAAVREDVGQLLGAAREKGTAAHGDEALAALMLAHLLKNVRPDEPEAARFAGVVRAWVPMHRAELLDRSPLHALCLDYNWRGLTGGPLASVQPPARWPGAPWERLLAASYYHTHVVLFASGTLRRRPDDSGSLAASLAFLRRNGERVLRLGWVDLCAEYALALSVCGGPGTLVEALQDALRAWQRPDGGWLAPAVGLRRARHAAMVATLALLEVPTAAASVG